MPTMEQIEKLDLSAEIMRMQTRDGLDEDTAQEAAEMYRKFLYLCSKYSDVRLTPSKLIDFAWHQHMADTKKYMTDCDVLMGEFIHHDPKVTGERMENYFGQTKQLFLKEFGIDLNLHPDANSRLAESCAH